MQKVVGLDISLQKTAICVLDRDGQLVWQGKVDSEPGPLIEKLKTWQDEIDLVGLEACPLSEWLYANLVEGRVQGGLRRGPPCTTLPFHSAGKD